MKICPVCQAECADDAVFCNKCGFNFSQAGAPAQQPSFCQNCGRPLDPGTTFCPGCGAKADGSALSGTNPFSDLGTTFTTLFKKGPQAAVNEAAGSKGLSWIIFAAAAIIMFMFAVALNIQQFFYFGAQRAFGSEELKFLKTVVKPLWGYSFGLGILFSFLVAAIGFFGIAATVYVVSKVILKKNVNFMSVLNMVGVASLPVACVAFLNMLIGFIWAPLTVITMGAALVYSFALMYNGAQKFTEGDAKAPGAFAIAFAVFAAVFFLVVALIVGIKAGNMFFNENGLIREPSSSDYSDYFKNKW